ncbi:thioredoxin [Patescibacteria group bacterium]
MIDLNKANFQKEVLESDLPVLVDFYADWCGPCQTAKPVLENLSKDYEGKINFGKVNIDQNQELAGKYGVMSIPTLVIFKEGKEVKRQVGFSGEGGVRELVGSAME